VKKKKSKIAQKSKGNDLLGGAELKGSNNGGLPGEKTLFDRDLTGKRYGGGGGGGGGGG